MSKKPSILTSATLLSLAVGLFLFLSGIQNLIDQNSLAGQVFGAFADKSTGVINLVAAILKIVSGVVLLVGPFELLSMAIRKLAFWVIVGFWTVLTVWLAATTVGAFKGDAKAILQWLESLSLNIAVLAALWTLKPEGK